MKAIRAAARESATAVADAVAAGRWSDVERQASDTKEKRMQARIRELEGQQFTVCVMVLLTQVQFRKMLRK